jgi:phosphoenolpyruvate synthase/pyruvate phosphate dikinase
MANSIMKVAQAVSLLIRKATASDYPVTNPAWTPYFLLAAWVVVDQGGVLSHGAIIAREYGLPAVVNVGPASKLIRTGQLLRVDADRGTVTILDEALPLADS